MKKIVVLSISLFIVFSISVPAQDNFKTIVVDDIVKANEIRTIEKPYHDPPPAFYQYVPDEIVLKLKEEIKPTEVRYEANQVLTGCTSLDELNKRFGVKYLRQEFPALPIRTLSRQTDELRKYYIIKFDRWYQSARVTCKGEIYPPGMDPFSPDAEPISESEFTCGEEGLVFHRLPNQGHGLRFSLG